MPVVAVVDTNVWVSAFLKPEGYPAKIYQALRSDKFVSITSPLLLAELTDVLSRPRLMKSRGFTAEDSRAFVADLTEASTVIQITGKLAICRDPDDDILLETALSGNSGMIVSRDEDLTRDLELKQQLQLHHIQILTVNRFLHHLAGG